MKRLRFLMLSGVMTVLAALTCAHAQVVLVSATLDANEITVGSSTTLRVTAEIVPAEKANVERIFSWYVDVLNTNGLAAAADYDSMVRPASDNDPITGSIGINDGDHRRAVYDTFLNLPGAGVLAPVTLVEIPILGVAPGATRFEVAAGTGEPSLAHDFLVAPIDGVGLLNGGDYTGAFADLLVTAGCDSLTLQITRVGMGGPGEALTLTFVPCTGFDHTVEFRDDLTAGSWQTLPGAPHNSGSVTVTNTVPRRFFRLQAQPQ